MASIRENSAAAWTDTSSHTGHWSLGGCQAKFALRLKNGHWHECLGAQATTHIIKLGVVGFEGQALVEYLSMRTARRVGLPVADVSYRWFGNEPAVIVARYDRIVHDDGSVERLHQEDLCQALGVSPLKKYAEQGGPSATDIIGLLKRTGAHARQNVYRFILYLFFNYVLGATDGHAKNHSIMFVAPDDIRLAPLYDVASMAPYRSLRPTQRKPLRAALAIGGENRFGTVGAAHVEKLAQTCALSELAIEPAFLINRLTTMAQLVPDALADEIADARRAGIPHIDAIADVFVREVRENCRRALERLGAEDAPR